MCENFEIGKKDVKILKLGNNMWKFVLLSALDMQEKKVICFLQPQVSNIVASNRLKINYPLHIVQALFVFSLSCLYLWGSYDDGFSIRRVTRLNTACLWMDISHWSRARSDNVQCIAAAYLLIQCYAKANLTRWVSVWFPITYRYRTVQGFGFLWSVVIADRQANFVEWCLDLCLR